MCAVERCKIQREGDDVDCVDIDEQDGALDGLEREDSVMKLSLERKQNLHFLVKKRRVISSADDPSRKCSHLLCTRDPECVVY